MGLSTDFYLIPDPYVLEDLTLIANQVLNMLK